MRALSVIGPDGRRWIVRRRWLPRAPRFRRPLGRRAARRASRRLDNLGPVAEVFFVIASEVAGLLVIVVFAALFLLNIVLPPIGWIIDAIVVTLVAVLGALGRFAFGRPWTIEASTEDMPPEVVGWRATGWFRTGAAIDEIAAAIRAGRPLPWTTRSGAIVIGGSPRAHRK